MVRRQESFGLVGFVQRGLGLSRHRQRVGYTLIELIIVVAIVAVLAVSTVALLFSTLRGTNRDRAIRDVKLSGDYVVSRIESLLRSAEMMIDNGSGQVCQETPVMSAVGIKTPDGVETVLWLDNGKIAATTGSVTSYLTANSVSVTKLEFSCRQLAGKAAFVGVELGLRRGDPGLDKPEEVFEETFRAGASLRSY